MVHNRMGVFEYLSFRQTFQNLRKYIQWSHPTDPPAISLPADQLHEVPSAALSEAPQKLCIGMEVFLDCSSVWAKGITVPRSDVGQIHTRNEADRCWTFFQCQITN